MLIVIEGLDGVGKSSLISELQRDFYATKHIIPLVIHCQKPKCFIEEAEDFQKKYYEKLMLETIPELLGYDNGYNRIIILDRSWLGEHIWSKFRGGYSTLFIQEYEKRMMKIIDPRNNNTFMFLLEHSEVFLEKRYKDDGLSMFKTEEERKDCKAQFQFCFSESFIKNKHYIPVSSPDGNWFTRQEVFDIIQLCMENKR